MAKTSKTGKEIHRVRNGKEHTYYIENAYDGPASAAQKIHRSIFGKTNALVNVIMADPSQVEEWTMRMEEYHRTADPAQQKHYSSLRRYVYAVLSEQIAGTPDAKRKKAALPLTLPRGTRTYIKPFGKLSAKELYEILKARFTVFVGEQHISYIDEDNIDYLSTHIFIRRQGLVIAYARLYPTTDRKVWQIGRLLTIERHQGYGRYIMTKAINEAKRLGAKSVILHAQTGTVKFYEALGFTAEGDVFIEADIPHICMKMTAI